MKKILLTFFAVAILLTACAAPQPKVVADTYFTLSVPADLKVFDYKIDCGKVFAIGDLRLLEFEQCWADSSKIEMYTMEDTYAEFRKKFADNSRLTAEVLPDRRIVETINFSELSNGYLYQPEEKIGTVAIWRTSTRGYALIDGGNKHQEDGLFRQLLLSFAFNNADL